MKLPTLNQVVTQVGAFNDKCKKGKNKKMMNSSSKTKKSKGATNG